MISRSVITDGLRLYLPGIPGYVPDGFGAIRATMQMRYSIDGRNVQLTLSGDVLPGEERCLVDDDDNLVDGCEWSSSGYMVERLLDHSQYELLHDGVRRLVMDALKQVGGSGDDTFELEHYHRYCGSQTTHLAVIDYLRRHATIDCLPIDYRILDERVSALCDKPVSCHVPSRIASGFFFLRIVRPMPCLDNNPPHKDAWLDRLRHGLNLYLPLAGSDQGSSLPVVPGSHLWRESDIPRVAPGGRVNGIAYSVPSVAMPDDKLEMTRPEVRPREGMLFSPYLIHGGAVNFNPDRTRVSLEMRFWRVAS